MQHTANYGISMIYSIQLSQIRLFLVLSWTVRAAFSPSARSWAIAGLAAGLRALLLPLVLATVLCPPSPACAATQYAEGSFTWGTSSVWATSTSGPFNQAWTAFNYAELLSPTGTISVSGSQSFNGIQFDVTGYVVNGGTLQIGNPSSPLAYISAVSGGTVTINSALEGSINSQSVNFGASSSYAGTVILTGAGTNFGSGSRTFNVANGVLNLQNTAMGTSAAVPVVVASGASLQLQSGSSLTFYNNLTLNGGGASSANGALESVSGTNTVSGAVSLASNSTIAVDSGNLTFSGGISGNGGLTTQGSGILTLTGSSSIGGSLTVGGGTIQFTAGQLTANNQELIGSGGAASFTQSGGTHSVPNGAMFVGYFNSGTYNFTGGSLSAFVEDIGESGEMQGQRGVCADLAR